VSKITNKYLQLSSPQYKFLPTPLASSSYVIWTPLRLPYEGAGNHIEPRSVHGGTGQRDKLTRRVQIIIKADASKQFIAPFRLLRLQRDEFDRSGGGASASRRRRRRGR